MAEKNKAELQDALDTAERRIEELEKENAGHKELAENLTTELQQAADALVALRADRGEAASLGLASGGVTPEPGSWLVTLKPGHPTGVYQRAGVEVSRSIPTILPPDCDPAVLTRLEEDRWLTVSEVGEVAAV